MSRAADQDAPLPDPTRSFAGGLPGRTRADTLAGVLAMVGACLVWGLMPLYFRQVNSVGPVEVLAHRTLWALAMFLILLAATGRLAGLARALTGPDLPRIALAALMISANWLLFIWSVQHGQVVQASLGYYIFPLVAVALGVLAFGERLGRQQALAVMLAAAAVLVLVLGLGVTPWISLAIALTFGLYGLVKKALVLDPITSVAAEVVVLAPAAAAWLVLAHGGLVEQGRAHFGDTLALDLWLIGSGAMTAVPLVLFSAATRRIRLGFVGVLQYLNPTLQFLIAVLLLREPFTRWHLIAFGLIWAALALFSAANLRGGALAKDPARV